MRQGAIAVMGLSSSTYWCLSFIGHCLLAQYSRTEGSSHTPCSSLRVEGPQASNMVVARGEDSENPDLSQFCVKNRRFWRAAPQVNEDFLRAR